MFSNVTQSDVKLALLEMRFRRRLVLIFVVVVGAIIFMLSINNKDNSSVNAELEIVSLKQKVEMLSRDQCSHKPIIIPHFPVIYAITPTYARPVQKAELTRLSHTLFLVPNLHWIIVEDAEKSTHLVSNLLMRSNVTFTHLVKPTPKIWKLKTKESNWKKPRGVLQRNTALKWIRDNLKLEVDNGVIYFADDDNTYSLEVFEEMRFTRGVSVWPVGLVGGLMVEKPVLDHVTGQVIGWNSGWKPERPFAVDMAGFAINVSLFLKNPKAMFSFEVESGYQETEILRHLVTLGQLEPRADNCTKVYVWHTRTEAPKLSVEEVRRRIGQHSDKNIEV